MRWRSLFGHESAYPNQEAGIERALETVAGGGYLALEGACGTGKTMLALTAGLTAVRSDTTPFERLLVVTSVKQQLRQFEADLERIHTTAGETGPPVSAVTLVGKADVCPYHLSGTGGMTDRTLYERCENLRSRTRELADAGHAPSGLARSARLDRADGGFAVDGSTAPYGGSMPTAEAADVGEVEYCPFYAQYLADGPTDDDPLTAVPFDYRGGGPLTPEDLVERGLEHGSCPHSMMGAILQDAEVVVGNYYHAFDPRTTAAFTGPILDDHTLLVCDEAHMLESRVRELASDSLALTTIERAQEELSEVIEYAKGRGGEGPRSVARSALDAAELDRRTLSRVHSFLGAVIEAVDAIVEERAPDPEATLALRDPDTVEPDRLTDRLVDAGYAEGDWSAVEGIGPVVERVLNAVDGEERWRATPSTGRFLSAWWDTDHETYFRSLSLERRANDRRGSGWRARSRARVRLDNCLPADVIAALLDRLGGGILMSATLAPMDVFTEATGLDRLVERGRTVETARYDLPFPADNRLDLVVDAPKFTYHNRGDPTEGSATREVYAETIAAVAASPGNVLVGMPSYTEARWAASDLEDRIEKPVLCDRSSDRAATDELKQRFFEGPPKVLVTSLRGTLTEGVDYEGDRLTAAIVCGVPIINTNDPTTRAMQTAYERRFDDGFDHALVVPAVRKARQALGRVIRGPDEVGVRALVDERYLRDGWDGVRRFLPTAEEFDIVQPADVAPAIDRFWAAHGSNT